MKTYELSYLISPNLTDVEIKNFQEKMSSLIQEKGILISSALPKRQILAYPIKKNNYAFFAILNFQMKPENLSEFEKKMKSEQVFISEPENVQNKESNLIRYLILTKTAPKSTGVRKKARIAGKKIETPEEEKVKIEKIEEKIEEALEENSKI